MNRRRFFLDGALASAVSIALKSVTLVFAAYISRAVGAEGVGLNALIVSAYGFALTFATSGISLTVTRLVAAAVGEGRENMVGATLRAAMLYALCFSSAATAVLLCFSGPIASALLGDARAAIPLEVLALSLIPSALLGVMSGYFVARRAVVKNSAVQIFSQLARIAATVLLLYRAEGGSVADLVLALCIGVAISELASCVLAAVLFASDRVGARRRERGGISLSPVASTALPLALSSYVRSGLLSVEHGVIQRRLRDRGESSSDALSSFGSLHGMALPIVTYPMTPLSAFSTLLLPEFAESEGAGDSARMSRIAGYAISATLSYAVISAVLLYVFSEHLGYGVYGSYSAGYFISILAPVVPLMYVDHVVDSMLKGVGEQVYSMWVNICDSALSVLLVWLLIPILGIEGYALVIIIMEAFNFILSYLRLYRRIRIRVDLVASAVLPLCAALGSAVAVDALFASGSTIPSWVVVCKISFSLCATIALLISLRLAYSSLSGRKKVVEQDHQRVP